MAIYVWDEIGGEAREIASVETAHYDAWTPEISKANTEGDDDHGWLAQHVIDLPNGTRIVIEMDERAHTAIIVTTAEES